MASPRLSEALAKADSDHMKTLLKDLKTCTVKCEKVDRPAAKLIYVGMRSLENFKGKDVAELSKAEVKRATEGAWKLHQGFLLNLKNQTESQEKLIALVHYMNSFDPKKKNLKKENLIVNIAFKDVFKKMPDNAEVYYWYGVYLSRKSGKSKTAVAKVFAKCLKIDPYLEKCKTPYNNLVADLTKPKCLASDIEDDFSMKSVSRLEENGYMVYKEKDRPKPLYINPHPVISKSDIATIQSEGDSLSISLTPQGAGKISKFTKGHVGDEVAFFYGDNIISNARITEEIKGGRLQLVPGPEKKEDLFKKICKSDAAQPLPEALKIH